MKRLCAFLYVGFVVSVPCSLHAQPPSREIQIGVEYAMPGMGKAFSEMGVPAVKPLAEPIAWGKMQPKRDAPIDFKRLDDLVREYHDAGFTEIVVGLRSLCPQWATPRPLQSQAPAPEFMPQYEEWIRAIVERYDGDGKDDMPGLKRPVRIYEIGTEFSSYQPEPVADYLRMLECAYKAAHAAYDKVVICHAAFLTTNAFNDNPKPHEYEQAFAKVSKRIMHHSLADMRAVLDRPDIFDAVNVHALEDPTMIENIVGWLRWEMKQRNYNKAIIISDTTPSPFIAWGPATRATGNPNSLGIVVPPATEADRPRLAEFFTKLVDGDKATEEWVHAFVGADMIKKICIAAEQQVALINTSFMEDLAWFKLKPMAAGAGISAWSGMAEVKINVREDSRTVTGLRSSFYAVKQVQQHIKGYTAVERVRLPENREKLPNDHSEVRLYKFTRGRGAVWVAWLDLKKQQLPGDKIPDAFIQLPTGAVTLTVEKMIDRDGQKSPERETVEAKNGSTQIKLTTMPIFILEK
jgi:hypothetical protein